MKKSVIIIIVAFLFSSCHFWDVQKDKYKETIVISFTTPNKSIMIGEKVVMSIEITPLSTLLNSSVIFSTLNNTIVTIEKVSDTSCIIEGINMGSGIIVAQLGSTTTKAVVVVE